MAGAILQVVPDSTMSLLRDPYRFVSERAATTGSDVFEIRLLLRRSICMTGPEAAAVFYDPARFQRAGAAPLRLQHTLFGQGGVQGLDAAPHHDRKQAFLDIVSPDRVEDLVATVSRHWSAAANAWAEADEIQLYPQLQDLLTRAACEWAGVPLSECEVDVRTRQITALFDAAGAVGPRHWRSRLARKAADRWAETLIENIRAESLRPPPRSAATVFANHRRPNGQRLPARVAGVELLNVIRPTVAVAVYLTFVAHALARYPEWKSRLAAGDGSEDEMFVQEIRRCYPFFPAVTAIVREDFEWHHHHFRKGRRALLDLYGTNHDPRAWPHPDRFDPERFRNWHGDPYTLIPQGGGDPRIHHRCPGEPISVRLMILAVEMLVRRLEYVVVSPDQPVEYTRLPALPRDGLVIRDVTKLQ
jgi:fatty-acid peroxygenase